MAAAATRATLRAHLEQSMRRDLKAVAIDEDALRRRIDDYYLPIFQWTDALVNKTRAARAAESTPRAEPSPVFVGLSCVQGGGKTTIAKYLEELLVFTGKKCAVVSLDDVYRTRSGQIALAEANPENPLLQYRGNPGTQDVKLLMDFVHECKTSSGEILVPRYDKSLHSGRGDRAPKSEWVKKQGPLDVLLIEGWCMGFQALASSDNLSPNMKPVNEALREFDQLYEQLHGLITIKVGDLNWIYKWRDEQEQHLRAANKPALSEAQVRDFVDRFMPASQSYLGPLYATATASAETPSSSSNLLAKLPQLTVEIDEARLPLRS